MLPSWNGSSWDIQVVDSEYGVGVFSSLALDPSDYPCISYFDNYNRSLKYASWNGSCWEIEIVDWGGIQTSLAVDNSDYAHIAYYDEITKSLNYSRQVESGIEESSSGYPCILSAIHPNPSSGVVSVYFRINEYSQVELQVFDISGRIVWQLPESSYTSGLHHITCDGLGTGVYLCRLTTGAVTEIRRFAVCEQ